jgi:uncharacterized protein YjbJ (UPF0337 family)
VPVGHSAEWKTKKYQPKSVPAPQAELKKGIRMKGSTRIAKGKVEEAAGVLAGNDKLRAKGQRDQMIGKVKQTTQKIADKAAKQLRK